MEYRYLGRSGLRVSALAMGTFTFGGRGDFGMVGSADVASAGRLVDACLDRGVNLIDTANMYSLGLSEEIVGEVMATRDPDTLICSKARMRIGDGPNDEGISRWHLIRECERSLKRLRRDHIDIYLMHEWDGRTPVEEAMAALDILVKHGKVRYFGCSNWSGWQVMKGLMASGAGGLERFTAQQIHYTLEARESEYELLPLSVDQGIGVMIWSPLVAGLLTGKHTREGFAEGSRQESGWTEPPIRDWDRLWRIVDVLRDVAEGHGVPPAQVALAWLLQRPAVATLVVGGRTEDQFAQTLAACDLKLSEEDVTKLDEVSRPPLIYPYWHQHQFAKPRFSDADWALHRGQKVDGLEGYSD
ncbi:aldo/keto reductase [Jannaschia aquimarina]|uniref:YhdN_3 protein n=1 Tax=Jannaschia aquimarina TaxID=935700 RepID=A0A0D1EB08_9RHOB|nr:aldo/keto reductase [Jannaschia aquimarina]KIT14929.1 General stress protein 69 [Jannaschia aquimarina]SNS59619.1 Predicted oxidoreductase [Jannaschia aquimarina]